LLLLLILLLLLLLLHCNSSAAGFVLSYTQTLYFGVHQAGCERLAGSFC
jgi:P pilus assembly chaperone PapD